MASTLLSFCPTFSPHLSSPKPPEKRTSRLSNRSLSSQKHRNPLNFQTSALGGDLLGDLGARDPFPAEIESNFGEKVVGCAGTEHKILIPNLAAISLSQKSCEPLSASQAPMQSKVAEKLLKKIPGWRLVEGDGGTRLHCLWKVRDYGCGVELFSRICRVVEATGHYPDLHIEQPNQVRAELWTSSIGGLSMNDFIVAAKIDEIKTLDLLSKKRVWALEKLLVVLEDTPSYYLQYETTDLLYCSQVWLEYE